MHDERLEEILRGFAAPEVSPRLDRRVMGEAGAVMARIRARAALNEFAWPVLNAFGFGWLNYLVDLVTSHDAEYRVELV